MDIKKLILKFLLFSILLATVYFLALWQLSKGQIDYFYPKFTYKASSLILGSSRACDGITPLVLQQNILNTEIDYPLLNFAFAHKTSDYGPIYLEAIQKKIVQETKDGLFIIEVNPATLSILSFKPDEESTLKKDESFLSTIDHFNKNPNFEYLRKMYTNSLYKGFERSRRIDPIRYTHDDGWQEVMMKSDFYEVSEAEILEWKSMKLKEGTYMVPNYTPSFARLNYLEKTISYLKKFGQVYLVRVPISAEFLEMEQSYWPEFNAKMKDIADKNQIVYFNYSNKGEQYRFYDGSHLFGSSAKVFTKQLAIDINSSTQYSNQ